MNSVQLSYPQNLFGPDQDLAPGQVVPAAVCDRPVTRALFFLRAFAHCKASNPAQLHSALSALPLDEVTDLIRRCFSARFPGYATVLFPEEREAAHGPGAIISSLHRVYTRTLLACDAESAWTWAICCRAVDDVGLLADSSANATRWLEDFADRLAKGKELILPDPSSSDPFDLAIRWGLAAVPEWPDYHTTAWVLTLSQIGRQRFYDGWSKSVSNPAAAWRAAAWLGMYGQHLWGRLLEDVLGHVFSKERAAPELSLPAPHGADHGVALVGATQSGKTSLLCTLAKDHPDFQYQIAEGNQWRSASPAEDPLKLWSTSGRFNTIPEQHFARRGFEGKLANGIRLVAYDVAGELLEKNTPAMETYQDFMRRSPPSAMVLLAGEPAELCQASANFIQVLEKLAATPPASAPHRFLFDVPILLLFNFADQLFLPWDENLRDTLLGELPLTCPVYRLRGNSEELPVTSVHGLIEALRESRDWASRPHQALAYETAIIRFSATLELLLPKFTQLTLAFGCCSGTARKELRRGIVSHWQSLHAIVARAAGAATNAALKQRFITQVADRTAELSSLRTLGERLSALRAPNLNIDSSAEARVKKDWMAMTSPEAFSQEFGKIEREFDAFVATLPNEAGWDVHESNSTGGPLNPFHWLFASLGIPVDEALSIPARSAPEGEALWFAWPAQTPTQSGWSRDITFNSRWDEGAPVIPSERRDGKGEQKLNELRLQKQVDPGRPVSLLFQQCLKDRVEGEIDELVRTFTHSRHDRGLFPMQSLEPGAGDIYAFHAAISASPRFDRLRSVWRCQKLAADALLAAGHLAFPTAQTGGVPQALGKVLKTAYLFRLLRCSEGGRALTAADLKTGCFGFLSSALPVKLRKMLAQTAKPILQQDKLETWLLGPNAAQNYLLHQTVNLGQALVAMADERLSGYLYANLRYASRSQWFTDRQTQIDELVARLEASTPAADPWVIYRGEGTTAIIPGANRIPYVEIFNT